MKPVVIAQPPEEVAFLRWSFSVFFAIGAAAVVFILCAAGVL